MAWNKGLVLVLQVLKASALYFAGVFAAGFVLGAIRTLWAVPALGARAAELIEAPIMLLVVALALFTRHGVHRGLAAA